MVPDRHVVLEIPILGVNSGVGKNFALASSSPCMIVGPSAFGPRSVMHKIVDYQIPRYLYPRKEY